MTGRHRGVTNSGAPRPLYARYKTPPSQRVGRQEAPSGFVPPRITRARLPSASASVVGLLRLRRRGWRAADRRADLVIEEGLPVGVWVSPNLVGCLYPRCPTSDLALVEGAYPGEVSEYEGSRFSPIRASGRIRRNVLGTLHRLSDCGVRSPRMYGRGGSRVVVEGPRGAGNAAWTVSLR